MRRMTAAMAVLVLGAVGAACGDDGGGGSGGESSSDEGQEYVDAIAASGDASELTDEESECFARAFVDAVGVENLREAATPEEIRDDPESSPAEFGITVDDDQADALWDGLNECRDLREAFVESIAEEEELADEAVECLNDAIDDDMLKRLLITGLVEGDEALEEDDELLGELVGVFSECPEALPES